MLSNLGGMLRAVALPGMFLGLILLRLAPCHPGLTAFSQRGFPDFLPVIDRAHHSLTSSWEFSTFVIEMFKHI